MRILLSDYFSIKGIDFFCWLSMLMNIYRFVDSILKLWVCKSRFLITLKALCSPNIGYFRHKIYIFVTARVSL
jgi:hypothetical protein